MAMMVVMDVLCGNGGIGYDDGMDGSVGYMTAVLDMKSCWQQWVAR